MSKTAIVIGATGLTGTHLVAALLQDPAFSKVKVLVRQPWAHARPKLESIIVDFDDEAALASVLQGDILFCCIGTTIKKAGSQENFRAVDYAIPVRCATIAYTQGVSQFLVISSIGANERSRNFYLRTKGEMEVAVQDIKFQSLAIFRPSFLLGQRQEFRPGEWISKYLILLFYFLLQGKWKKYRGIKAATVANAMMIAAKEAIGGVSIYESDAIQLMGAS
ncbi:oxidoreductase [Chitinophaga sp. 212800010-3]|uniref:oxidoreductase n=1 Tax=unclassified Chitinophaga TaxID=2619133 RepID=UPI002DF3B98E|nr:NAD(P)-bd-dom domain-containing protein [Chitinophaga sp. 212800010-3]